MKLMIFFLLTFFVVAAYAQDESVGIFSNHADVGKPKISGSTTFDASSQTYTLKGAGYNIWFGRDEFQYAFKKIKGDFVLTANFEFIGTGVDPHRKVGWMIRQTLDEDASHVSAVVHGDGLTVLQWRMLKGAHMRDPQDEIFAVKKRFSTLQLERVGNKIIMRAAHVGEPLQLIGETEAVNFADEVFAGLFICSHNPDVAEEAKAYNVRIDRPVPGSYNPNKEGWIGCRMEILEVATGHRKVIHESKGRFEAPNYMPDGKRLLFNENGSLYTIPVEGGIPEKLNTDFADRNNNDHGISFDGKMLAISHHRQGLPGGGSTVYVLPIKGGVPKMITEKTPSYWHGWNPNGKEVVYVAQRDGKVYDIYKKNINGGEEIQLTQNKGTHVDGPEYSPDGKYIYYNGNTSGTMQIWRMKPDGSGKEQLTFDEYNNWFPHISPDGRQLVMISFPPDIDVDSHPSYKRVMLRLMPLSGGGGPKVIAYLYGGQGTINVPSWAPDGKSIAFVSNSERFETESKTP
jgi:TolB protein